MRRNKGNSWCLPIVDLAFNFDLWLYGRHSLHIEMDSFLLLRYRKVKVM